MAKRLADIVAHIDNIRQLRAVVTAMRGIAAARAQQSRGLLAGIESHARIVARGIGEAMLLAPQPAGGEDIHPQSRKALILFCAEGGFCGGLSDRVLDEAVKAADTDIEILIAGARGATIAQERGIAAGWTTSSANQMGAIPVAAQRIAETLYRGIAEGRYLRAEIIYPKPVTGAAPQIARQMLLPLDLERFRVAGRPQAPLANLPWQVLVARMAEEYVYAELCNAATHGFIAENEARMMAMAAARDHIDDMLAGLVRREHQARQEEITSEIVELSASVALRHQVLQSRNS